MQATVFYFTGKENKTAPKREFSFKGGKRFIVEPIYCPEKFKKRIFETASEIVLLDVEAKAESPGRTLLKWLSRQKMVLKIIVICENIGEILDLLRMGAKSVVPQGNEDFLTTALDDVSNGYTYLPEPLGPELARQIQSEYVPHKTLILWGRLSKRQKDILNYCNQGYHNKDIAVLLGISLKTLQNQITLLLKKLNLDSLKKAEKLFPGIVYREYRNFT